LWNGYMLEVLGLANATVAGGAADDGGGEGRAAQTTTTTTMREVSVAAQGSLLASADLHGAEVEVVRCRDAGKVGFRGIVVRETKFTLVIVMRGDKVRTVMKKGAVFAYEVRIEEGRSVKLEMVGDAMLFRPVERATRKFKWRGLDV
jgi:ribonuclease P protein subunit POP4